MRARLGVLVLVLSWATMASAAELTASKDRVRVSTFELTTLSGKRFQSADLRGKVAVISFWATWCAPCKQELDLLSKLAVKNETPGLVVVAIATDGPETVSSVRSVARRKRWAFVTGLDSDGTVAALLNPRGSVPYTLFVDRQGRVAHVHSGYTSGDRVSYEEWIAQLLEESRP